MCSRRGFESPHLHQKDVYEIARYLRFIDSDQHVDHGRSSGHKFCMDKSVFLMGMYRYSIGQIVRDGNTVGDDR